MSIRDPEVLEALRDEPELLAIADAVTETQRTPRSSRRRVASRLAAVAALGVAILLAVLLWPSGGARSPILGRALAAIGDGPILHLVVRMPSGAELVDVHTGQTTMPAYDLESWSDRDLKRFHMIMRVDGRIVGEYLYPQDGGSGMTLGRVNPAYTAFWTGYRQALANGSAKIDAEGTLDGHDVYWLSFPALGNSPGRNQVAIARDTYEPLDFRYHVGERVLDNRILLARTEPFSESAFKRQTALPNPLSGTGTGSSTVQVGPVRPGGRAKPWLEARSSIAGVKLSAIHETETIANGRRSKGFELVYGTETSMRRSVLVDEAKHPDDPADWKGIPKGLMRISVGEASGTGGTSYSLWTGNVVVEGVYVTIQTGLGRAAVLEAARALRPA